MTNEEQAGRVTDPEGFCRFFERCETSLIEEPETCDVCVWYRDAGSLCVRDNEE